MIIPIYNSEKYLKKCLDSIINQTYRNIEIILINDGSTDNSGYICEEYAQKDSRIKVENIKNSGVSKARNLGISLSTGDYITFIDADDYIKENTVEKINTIIAKDDIDLIKYSYYKVAGKIKKRYQFTIKENTKIMQDNYKEEVIKYLYLTNDLGNVWNCFFKKDIINRLQFDISLKYGEDRKFMIEALMNSNSIYFNSDAYYYYNINPNSAINNMSEEKSYMKLFNVMKSNLSTYKLLENNDKNKEQITKIVKEDLEYHIINYLKLNTYDSYKNELNLLLNKKELNEQLNYFKEMTNQDIEFLFSKEYFLTLKRKRLKNKIKNRIKKIILK